VGGCKAFAVVHDGKKQKHPARSVNKKKKKKKNKKPGTQRQVHCESAGKSSKGWYPDNGKKREAPGRIYRKKGRSLNGGGGNSQKVSVQRDITNRARSPGKGGRKGGNAGGGRV